MDVTVAEGSGACKPLARYFTFSALSLLCEIATFLSVVF